MRKLLGYNFEIVYKAGKNNEVADALSRKRSDIEMAAMGGPKWRDWEVLQQEIANDMFLQKIITDLQTDAMSHKGFTIDNDVLLFKDRLVIPQNSSMLNALFEEFHASPTGGHAGEERTYQRIVNEVFWVGMKKDILARVKACEVCQRNKQLSGSVAGLLQPIPLPLRVWEELSMDFIEGLPKSGGMTTILVVVDRLSKYAHFLAFKHPFNAQSVAEVFNKEIVRLHGVPEAIISDRDRIYLSNFWIELFKLQGTKLKFSTAYHPQTDGQTEVVNKCLEQYLRCFVSNKPKNWLKFLSWAEYSYNTAHHTSTKTSPFKLLYGRDPPPLIRYKVHSAKIDQVEQDLLERDRVLDEARMQL